MSRVLNYVPKVAIFLAGVAAGALAGLWREGGGVDEAALQNLKRSVADLENRLVSLEAANNSRFARAESSLEEHSAKLAEIPTTTQIVAAMEQLLARTMSSLDERLTTQAHSIEVLKTTVSQTDSLLERVLESLDSLQSYADPGELAEDALLHRPAV